MAAINKEVAAYVEALETRVRLRDPLRINVLNIGHLGNGYLQAREREGVFRGGDGVGVVVVGVYCLFMVVFFLLLLRCISDSSLWRTHDRPKRRGNWLKRASAIAPAPSLLFAPTSSTFSQHCLSRGFASNSTNPRDLFLTLFF